MVRLVALEDDKHPEYIGWSGTCTLIRFNQKALIFCTKHQLNIKNSEEPNLNMLDTIRFTTSIDGDFLSNIPVNQCVFETSNPEEEFNDILMFRVDDSWPNLSAEMPNFFPIKKTKAINRVHSLFFGCPFLDGVMEYEPPMVNIKTYYSDCKFDGKFKSENKHFKRYKYSNIVQIVDGISGGAIFSLVGGLNNSEIIFDGIIVRAGNGFIHVIDADYIFHLASKN